MTASVYDPSPEAVQSNTSVGGPAFTVADTLLILRRGWRLPLLGCLLGLAVGVGFVLYKPVLYKSTARILIDRSVNRFMQANKVLDEPTFDDSEIGGQVFVLSSESIVLPVVRSMDLVHDPEFTGNSGDHTQSWTSLRSIIKSAKSYLGWDTKPSLEQEAALERVAVENFLKHLTVDREGAGVISVTFASEDSKKAAQIANAIVDSYLASTTDARSKSTKMAGQLLQDRLMELKQTVLEANKAVQDFRSANKVPGKGTGLLATEQIADLRTQLANANIQVAEAKSRLDSVQELMRDEAAAGTVFPDNQVIVGLRSKYRELSIKATELSNRVGADHFAVIKVREEMDEVRTAIREEEKRLAAGYVNAYQAARTHSDELAAMMSTLTEEAKAESQAQATIRELESKADSLRDLYNKVLERFNALAIQPDISIQDARIITRASPPLYKNSSKALAVLAGGFLVGLLIGAGGAIAREMASGVFRTPEQVKQATGIYCVSLPVVGEVKSQDSTEVSEEFVRDKLASGSKNLFANIRAFFSNPATVASPTSVQVGQDANTESMSASGVKPIGDQTASSQDTNSPFLLEEYVLDAPYSRFTEAFRNVKALAYSAKRAYGAKVIGVVSPVSKNGKSTTLMNLATLMAMSARTLVIDGDLHRRLLTARLQPDAREGFIEALGDPSRLDQLVHKRPRSGLDFLPCVLSQRITNAAELLGSPQMERLMNVARESYDYIIIECPPILSVVDAKMAEVFIDSFVFVIEWGQTKRRVVQEALDELDVTRERTLCFVLNKVDPTMLRFMDAYKGPHYDAYYQT